MRTILATLFAAVIAFAVFNAEAGPYLEAGIGRHGMFQKDWQGRNEVGTWFAGGYVWHAQGFDIDLGWYHSSQPAVGKPYNNEPEDTLDSVIIKVRKEWD